ncbi:MAG: site-specific integrase [Deltaproteobacteria bacterium]|nr:site-specific integrase [Deltaproteobacteria bacterium]
MAAKYYKTKYPGVRYREHPSRKHGLKPDIYFAIYYYANGRRKDEGLGWASNKWTIEKAAGELARLKEANRTGRGPKTLKESREISEERRAVKEAEKEKAARDSITFGEYFEKDYLPNQSFKKFNTIRTEKVYFKTWINPYIGGMVFKDILPLHIEKIKKAMTDKRKAARSIEYNLSIIRQAWNQAKRDGLIDRDSPTKQVKKPKYDNKRIAFYNHEQADTLLKTVKEKSEQLHNMVLLSLHTGMRAGEIFRLKWADVDLTEGLISIQDAKGGSGNAYMTKEVKAMFQAIKPDDNHASELIFKSMDGKMIKEVSRTFDRVIEDLKFNEDITDRRQKLTFHSLRHTFASWLVMQGTPLYTVQKLMRHKTIALTERYAHLAPDVLRTAIMNLEKNIKRQKKIKAEVINLKG